MLQKKIPPQTEPPDSDLNMAGAPSVRPLRPPAPGPLRVHTLFHLVTFDPAELAVDGALTGMVNERGHIGAHREAD